MTQPDLDAFYQELESRTEEAIVRGALRGMIRVLPAPQEQRSTDELAAELARRMLPAKSPVVVEEKKKRAS